MAAAAGSISRLTLEDAKAIARCNQNIVHVDGNVQGSVQVVYGDKNANTQVTGALPVYEQMRNATPYYGRFYTEAENQAQARELFGDMNAGKPVPKNLITGSHVGT